VEPDATRAPEATGAHAAGDAPNGGHLHHLDVSARMRRALALISGTVAVLVVVGMVWIGFGTDVKPAVSGLLAGKVYEAKVTGVRVGPCAGTTSAEAIECDLVDVRLTQGPDRGDRETLSFSSDSPTTPKLHKGDRVVLSYQADAEPGFRYQYADRQRRPALLALSLVFAIAVVLLGRWRGVAALGGIVISLVVILKFILPGILEGESPVLVAVLGSAAIAYVALYLAHGVNSLTTVALLGTLAALALTFVLSAVFTAASHFSGFASDESLVLGQLAHNVDINGLILAGIVIGTLGALDDVTVTQASAVAELHDANPRTPRGALYKAGIRIGRDHIASTVNTLALAYAGASLPLLLLFLLSSTSLGAVANSEVVAIEIVRTLVGSIGLVAAVPITTWLASRVVGSGGVTVPTGGPASGTVEADTTDAKWEALPPPKPRARRRQRASDAGDSESSFWS
jgi:uncharacterized membrane protein